MSSTDDMSSSFIFHRFFTTELYFYVSRMVWQDICCLVYYLATQMQQYIVNMSVCVSNTQSLFTLTLNRTRVQTYDNFMLSVLRILIRKIYPCITIYITLCSYVKYALMVVIRLDIFLYCLMYSLVYILH